MQELIQAVNKHNPESVQEQYGQMTVIVAVSQICQFLKAMRDDESLAMEMLIDLTACDFLTYGQTDWVTNQATEEGFSRGRAVAQAYQSEQDNRFAVIYHLLSLRLGWRVRVMSYLPAGQCVVPSVSDIWPNANWYEREVYDLFGIFFEGHPDCRRLLTDYGFIGHPFRKDFELSGYTEIRYDGERATCVHEPTSVTPRVNIPRVIRKT